MNVSFSQSTSIVFILVLILAAFLLAGCAMMDATFNKKYGTLSVVELDEMLQNRSPLTVVDARKKDTFEKSHIEGAINIPMGEFDDTLTSIPKDKPVAIICYLGLFSKVGAQKLLKNGYTNVYSVSGGMRAWQKHLVRKAD